MLHTGGGRGDTPPPPHNVERFECLEKAEKRYINVMNYYYYYSSCLHNFQKNDIIFGLLNGICITQFTLNIILILGKFYIHKCKCLKTKPLFSVFQKEFWMYCKSVRLLKCKTGRKLFSILQTFKLLEDPMV